MQNIAEAISRLGQPDCLDYISVVLSIVSVIVSAAAIWAAIEIPKKIAAQQNKIALFEKRQHFFDDAEFYVTKFLPSWEFDLSKNDFFSKYSAAYVGALFNEDVKAFIIHLEESSEQINVLWGDFKHAQEHGECNGKGPSAIEDEIHEIRHAELANFEKLRDTKLLGYFKL